MKKIILFSFIALTFLLSENAFAGISQTNFNTTLDNAEHGSVQKLGTGLSGNVSQISIYCKAITGTTTSVKIFEFDDASYNNMDFNTLGQGSTDVKTYYASPNSSSTSELKIDCPTDIANWVNNDWTHYTYYSRLSDTWTNPTGTDLFSFNPNKYYILYTYNISDFYSYGSATDTYSNGNCYEGTFGIGMYCYDILDFAFNISGNATNPTCFDGIENQDEEDIDVGGICGYPTDYIFGAIFEESFYDSGTGAEISNGTNIENIFGSTGFRIKGVNPYGAYDLIHVSILEDDIEISTKDYAISVISDEWYNYVNTDLQSLANASDNPFVYELGKKYTFNVLVSGELIYEESNYFNLSGFLYYGSGETCDSFDLVCYVKKWGTWLFGINDTVLDNFSSLTLENSLPFSYLYDMGNLYTELFNDTPQNIDIAVAFAGSEIQLLSTEQLEDVPFQGTVRTVLGALMIFGTAMLIYRKVLHIHDKEEVKTTV